MTVTGISRPKGPSQETGIFLGLIPRNYEWWGLGLALANNQNRTPSVYLGLTLRARAFGDYGLASFFVGAVNRQYVAFPKSIVGQTFSADSSSLSGSLRSQTSAAIGFNLGFKFGTISPDTTITGPVASSQAAH